MSESEHAHKEKEHGHGGHGGGHGGGGGHEEHEGAPEWLISFADNVTLMMGFFVILLAITMSKAAGGSGTAEASAQTPSDEMLDAAVAIREAFHNPVDVRSSSPRDRELILHILRRRGETHATQAGPRGDADKLQAVRLSDYRRACGAVPFEPGGIVMGKAAQGSVAEAARTMRGLRFVVEVRGHVSARQAAQSDDRGMKLCFERALVVAKALVDQGVDWRQIRIVSAADNDRVKPLAYGAAQQQMNDSVDVLLTDEPLNDYTPRTEEKSSSAGEAMPAAPAAAHSARDQDAEGDPGDMKHKDG